MRYFVIRGFGVKKDSKGRPVDFDRVHAELIAPALRQCGCTGDTTAQVVEAGNIREDMFALIVEADIVVCDITVHNANVFYELGIRHALRRKHTVLIKGDPSADDTPFDLSTDRYLKYPIERPGDAVGALVATIKAGMNGNRGTDSPIFLMLPRLAEANTAEMYSVPLDFIEEVQRAEASCDKGWLRLLAEEVRGERFEWDGLKAVGRAQWSLKDFEGARESWEAVREAYPDELEANLALGNIYERLYKLGGLPALLERSNQAILRVLGRQDLALTQRAEALALEGRNLKTLWRLGFREAGTVEERRAKALDVRLLRYYEAYRDAFRVDLNSFFPGIAAYQAGRILQTFSANASWRNLFGRDKVEAHRYREDLDRELLSLEHVVAASIARALERCTGDDLMWAKISEADLLFLTEPEAALAADPSLAIDAYAAAIPEGKRFAWDAARGQLSLFAELGIRAKAAEAVISALDGAGSAKADPLHLVVFSGHTIDAPDTPQPRFPAAAEARARQLIEARLRAIRREGEQLRVLASAAPGADIVALEACKELGIPSTLCLPMPSQIVARDVFCTYDAWRNRLFSVVQAHAKCTLQLQDDAQLPRWLRSRSTTPWERGNRWVLRLAQAWGADRVTLLAFWDGSETDVSGGTAQMVRLAREAGSIHLDIIDSRQLLSETTS